MTIHKGHNNILWISAAEASGDMHGAKLINYISSITSDLEFRGMGGSEMRKTDFQEEFNSEQLSILGFTEVFAFLPFIFRLLKNVKQRLKSLRPKAVILIDSPDLHFRIAKIAKKLNIPVYYYISPQVWAWRKGRVRFLRKYVDEMLCILPFEESFFKEHGVRAHFVGHPLQDELKDYKTQEIEDKTIVMLPGSRQKEVKNLLPSFARAASILAAYDPQIRFRLIKASQIAESSIHESWPDHVPLDIYTSTKRYTMISSSQFAICASGTITLEVSLLGVPALVSYKLSFLSYLLGRLLIKVPYISLTNLILNKQVLPEFIQKQATGENLANQIISWLQNPAQQAEIRHELSRLSQKLGPPGASKRAGDIILDRLNM